MCSVCEKGFVESFGECGACQPDWVHWVVSMVCLCLLFGLLYWVWVKPVISMKDTDTADKVKTKVTTAIFEDHYVVVRISFAPGLPQAHTIFALRFNLAHRMTHSSLDCGWPSHFALCSLSQMSQVLFVYQAVPWSESDTLLLSSIKCKDVTALALFTSNSVPFQ